MPHVTELTIGGGLTADDVKQHIAPVLLRLRRMITVIVQGGTIN